MRVNVSILRFLSATRSSPLSASVMNSKLLPEHNTKSEAAARGGSLALQLRGKLFFVDCLHSCLRSGHGHRVTADVC